MIARRWILLGTVLLVVGLPACADGNSNAGDTKAKGEEIVATSNGTSITMAEVEKEVASQLRELHQQEYELRRDAVRGIVLDRLVDAKAAAEGLTRDQLVEREVRALAAQPSPEEIKAIYDQYKDQPVLKGKSLEEATPIIAPQLERQLLQKAQGEYVESLLKEANIVFLLEPPRVEVAIPAGEPSKGPADAPVTMVEFSDFQCTFCKRAHPVVQQLLAEYGDKIRFVYRDYGIPNHDRARPSAEAARCAGDQGKYWEYFDNLMTAPGSLDDGDLAARATAIGLDAAAFQACLDSDVHVAAIDASFDAAGELGIGGTPTFFINGRVLVGAKTIEEFRAVIDEELARTKAS